MIKIDIDRQTSKKQFNFKKMLRIGLIAAIIFISIGIIFALLPQDGQQQNPQQTIQVPQEYYDLSLEMIENTYGYKYLKIENIGKNINDASDFLILSYPPDSLNNYGIPDCSISTIDFDFVYFNKGDIVYYYFNSDDETMHISKYEPTTIIDLVDGTWRFDLIVKGNVINSNNYNVDNSKLKICDNTSNIASTIKKSSDYDTILITKGEYYEHLIIDRPLYIKGKDNPTINGGNLGNIITIESNNVYISGLTFKNSGMSLYDSAIISSLVDNVTINNCEFENNANGIYITLCTNFKIYNNIFYDNTADGILLENSNYNLIRSNTLYNNNNGVYLKNSDFNYIKENSVNDHNEYGIFIEKHGAFDNTCEYNYWGNDDCYCNRIIVPVNAVIFQNDPNSVCGIYSKSNVVILHEWETYISDLTSDTQPNDNNVNYFDF